ncbi:PREDICTED: tubulin glycylase 3A-like [Nicrophorus vespilloides]|uniref:Tubulin glycylase 3A-like n=1 Tax=Nicrophorus vespilloides TaxID=110193 RepID=A0ABM1MSF7_NICVS|nr:PREDICTED: tubulin glycylase 3A-like [Nicrophorus vespilloides]
MWPCVDMDGYMNIWILKPSYGSRGVGIYFCRTLQYVLKVLKEHKNNSYVIQKYIERPLLIHHTKFDIRQWFLISSTMPLTIWIYKECYLRFSSQTYNLRKLHESIHLTNNSVQSKYHNGNRDPGLPAHNMWFLREFKEHLTNLGYPHVYDDIIFPGIKECITAAVLATQDQIYRTSKAFELHGADFMITEDFIPWLIEINSKPALNPSTAVTSKLCPAVLEDVIKVVIDHARNPKAPTGNFELLYKEKVMTLPPVDDSVLQIKGQPIDANYFLTPEQEQNMPINTTSDRSGDSINIIKTTDYMKYIGKEMKNTLKQLLALVEKEKERRRRLREPNAAGEMDMESFECCEDMEKIKRNMKEIQEIFKFNEKGGKRASVNQICLPKASESLLRTNSNKIKEAIGSLENKSKEKEPSTSIFSNIMNMIEAFNYPAT